jgi:hypothetical protein
MKKGDLVRAHNKAQTIGVVMCVDSASGLQFGPAYHAHNTPSRRIQVFAEGEIQWWWKDNVTIISEAASETKG